MNGVKEILGLQGKESIVEMPVWQKGGGFVAAVIIPSTYLFIRFQNSTNTRTLRICCYTGATDDFRQRRCTSQSEACIKGMVQHWFFWRSPCI